jgi:hypothetical protein
MLENYKRFLREIMKVNERVDLAIKIQSVPYSERSSDDLAFVLDAIERRVDHIQSQLIKGIEIIKELEKIEDATKEMNGAEIYVFPWINEYDRPLHSSIGHPGQN